MPLAGIASVVLLGLIAVVIAAIVALIAQGASDPGSAPIDGMFDWLPFGSGRRRRR